MVKISHINKRLSFKSGFTLIELMIVVAVLGILSHVVMLKMGDIIDKARIAQIQRIIANHKVAYLNYYFAVGDYPPDSDTFTTPDNPFEIDPGVSGWDGPYLAKSIPHPWGGHIAYRRIFDMNGNGIGDVVMLFDDDAHMTNAADNSGPIPDYLIARIDAKMDDGDPLTGNIKSWPFGNIPKGEMAYIFDWDIP